MKNIIYFDAQDMKSFDLDRFKKSLGKYASVPEDAVKKGLKTVEQYENMHVSVLVELGAALIAEYGSEEIAEKYLSDHAMYFGNKFERLRRITGYLVGTLDRWNDGKKSEEHDRVKHSVNSSIDDGERASRLEEMRVARSVAYAA